MQLRSWSTLRSYTAWGQCAAPRKAANSLDSLVRAVYGNIDDGVLVDVAEEKLRLDDELLRLEAYRNFQYLRGGEGRGRTSGDENTVLVCFTPLSDDALYDVRDRRACAERVVNPFCPESTRCDGTLPEPMPMTFPSPDEPSGVLAENVGRRDAPCVRGGCVGRRPSMQPSALQLLRSKLV